MLFQIYGDGAGWQLLGYWCLPDLFLQMNSQDVQKSVD